MKVVKVLVVIAGLALLVVGGWLCFASAARGESSSYFLTRLFGGIAVLSCGFFMIGWGTGYFSRMNRKRDRAWELHQQGADDASIAQELGMSPKKVRNLLAQRRRSDRG